MRASVAIVHNDPTFLEIAAVALRDAGHDVVAFDDSMTALNEINAAGHFEVLITRVSFPEGKPNGASLALVLRTKYPRLKAIFAARAEWQTYIEGIGELIPHPVDLPKLVETVTRAAEEGRRGSTLNK